MSSKLPNPGESAAPARLERVQSLSRNEPIPSALLFAGAREVLIDHNNTIYRLRITGPGKLILQK